MKESERTLREQLGRGLRQARQACQLTQAQVAERVETDPETISRFERGATLPSLPRLLALAEALDVTLVSLLSAASPRPKDQFEEIGHSLAKLTVDDRRLATALMKTLVEVRGV